MGEVFITRKGGGGKAAAPTIAVTDVGGTWIEFEITNNDAAPSGATIFVLANYDPTSETDFDLQASQNGLVFAVAEGATVTQLITGLDPDTSHTVSASAAVIKKLPSSIVTTDTINLAGTGVTAPTVGPITETLFTSTTFNVRNDDTVVPQIIKTNITESTTVPSVYPFESSTLAALATGSITVSNLTSGTVYYIHARAFDGAFSSSNVVFGPYTQPAPIVATGGTITNYSSGGIDYKVHTFLGNGTFAVSNESVSPFNLVEYLIVGGGGGASGGSSGGGGGAGGFRTSVVGAISGRGAAAENRFTVSATSYPVTVGSGSTGLQTGTRPNGANSSIFSIVSLGGGGTTDGSPGQNGGCGGGLRDPSNRSIGGIGAAGQGFDGGAVTGSHYTGACGYPGSGGGGAAGNGGPTVCTKGGNGGPGQISFIRTGTGVYYAGGGGGSTQAGQQTSLGGIGGGGNGRGGSGSQIGFFGVANTGGGGGGGNTAAGGNGGSGIVVIRYVVGGNV